MLTRRRFLVCAGAATAPVWARRTAAAAQPLTVADLMVRAGGALAPAPAGTVDGLKAGSPAMPVTGVATTAMATVDVLRRAAAAGKNLVITCEPTFFSRTDDPSPANRTEDPVFAGKRALLAEQGFAVWRLRDGWRGRRPDPMSAGLASALGWQPAVEDPSRVELPTTLLRSLVNHVQERLGARALRVVGAPDLPVRRVVLSPGASPGAATFAALPTTDVIVAGEPREWEAVEYVQDAIAAGMPKAMVIVGRVLSEDPGMRGLADWLPGIVPGLAATWLPVGDPYWRPR